MPSVRRAFSLLELVVVVAIVAILAAMAVPRYAWAIQRFRVEAAAHRIAADLAMVQSRANTTSSPQRIVFDTATHRYWVEGMADLDHTGGTYTVRLADPPYQVQLFLADFEGQPDVSFDGFGVAARGGTLKVRAGDTERIITFDRATGKVVIQ